MAAVTSVAVSAARAEQRERFLAVTARLVETEGTSAVTMERVAALAGLSKPVAYKHFSDRGDLLRALLERCWEELDRSVQQRLRTATTFEAHVEALVAGYFAAVAAQGPVLQVLLSGASSEPAVEAARRERHRVAQAQWSAFYIARGGLPPQVADAAAAILRSALEGATAYWLEHPDVSVDLCASTCTDVVRGGLDRLRRTQRSATAADRPVPVGPPAARGPRGSAPH